MQKKPRQGSRRGSVSRACFSSGIEPLESRRAELARGLGYMKFREGDQPKTRVKEQDVDDRKNLGRCMQYLKDTADDVLTLSADSIRVVKWWVDGSYACHEDCRSQTGGTMSMGRGSVYNTSPKQKLNTKRSTKTEAVATDDCVPQIMWTKYFLIYCAHNLARPN